MRKQNRKSQVMKRTLKYTAGALLTLTIVMQPCFSFTAQAYTSTDIYGKGYPYWDDPYEGNDSYRYDDDGRKLTKVTRTYDDGTAFTSVYQYNDQGYLIFASTVQPNGSKETLKRAYKGDILVSETSYEYDAEEKAEKTAITDYTEHGSSSHTLHTIKDSDGTHSLETWYLDNSSPLKTVEVETDGTTTQTDYTYHEQGGNLTVISSSSNGDREQKEWQYNEAGEAILYKQHSYSASDQETYMLETRLEGDDETGVIYTVESTSNREGLITKEETWLRAADYQVVKEVTTMPDGFQSTSNYTYDSEGDEILFTRINSDGTTERRETSHTQTGSKTVYSDSRGVSYSRASSYDEKTGQSIRESTYKYSDGSSSYSKQVNYDTSYQSTYISRETSADGTETYTENTVAFDGSNTTKTKTSDGILVVTERDAEGTVVGKRTTLADGTTAKTTWTWQADEQPASEVTQYSDGSEDRIDYEYDEAGNLIKETETRRNGVGAVTLTQYKDVDRNTGTLTMAFNNGYEVTFTRDFIDENTQQCIYTYSTGDIYQDIIIEKADASLYTKTVYRDGRTEESTLNLDNDDSYYVSYDKMNFFLKRYSDFIDFAWTILPSQAAAPAVATASDAAQSDTGAGQ